MNYLLTINDIKMKDFTIVSSLLTFCTEMFCCCSECKKKIEMSHLSNTHFTKLPLWDNAIFEYKEKINMLQKSY